MALAVVFGALGERGFNAVVQSAPTEPQIDPAWLKHIFGGGN
jgi:hypothetical protein